MKIKKTYLHSAILQTLDQIATAVHKCAKAHGWHSLEQTDHQFLADQICNFHGEASELWEAIRRGDQNSLCDKAEGMVALGLPPLTCLEEELADLIIRPLDVSRRLGVDISRAVQIKMLFNESRPYRHGGKVA